MSSTGQIMSWITLDRGYSRYRKRMRMRQKESKSRIRRLVYKEVREKRRKSKSSETYQSY